MHATLVPLSIEPDKVDWARIDLFRRRFIILWDNFKDLNLGRFTGGFSKQDDGSYLGGFDLPNEYRLKGLYVDFRHFCLNDEPTNVYRFANYLMSLTDSDGYRRFMKEEKRNFRSEFIEDGWFKHKGNGVTTKQVLDIWFNADLFHSDPMKRELMLDWTECFATKTARSMLFLSVYDSILIIRNIHWSCKQLAKDHLYLRMPKFSQA